MSQNNDMKFTDTEYRFTLITIFSIGLLLLIVFIGLILFTYREQLKSGELPKGKPGYEATSMDYGGYNSPYDTGIPQAYPEATPVPNYPSSTEAPLDEQGEPMSYGKRDG